MKLKKEEEEDKRNKIPLSIVLLSEWTLCTVIYPYWIVIHLTCLFIKNSSSVLHTRLCTEENIKHRTVIANDIPKDIGTYLLILLYCRMSYNSFSLKRCVYVDIVWMRKEKNVTTPAEAKKTRCRKERKKRSPMERWEEKNQQQQQKHEERSERSVTRIRSTQNNFNRNGFGRKWDISFEKVQ